MLTHTNIALLALV